MRTFTGQVSLPDDPTVTVTARIESDDASVVLTTDSDELGNWPQEAVCIVRDGARSFRMIVDDGEVLFVPDDPILFEAWDVVLENPPPEPNTKPRGRVKKRRPPKNREAETTSDAANRTASPTSQPQRPGRTRHVVMRLSNAGTQAMKALGEAGEKPSDAMEEGPTPDTEGAGKRTKAALAAAGTKMGDSRIVTGSRHRLRVSWLWTLDRLRQSEILGMDRLPTLTADKLVDRDHVHTFEARTAGAGISRNVCTECGHVGLTAEED